MGFLSRLILLALVGFVLWTWMAGTARAEVHVAPAPEAGYQFVALSGQDATEAPTVRNASSGAVVVRSAVRSDANGSLYRVGPCLSGAIEVVTPASYGVYPCAAPASATSIQQLASRISLIESRISELDRAIQRLNASAVSLNRSLDQVSDQGIGTKADVANVTAAVASLKRDVNGMAVPKDLALGSDLEATETSITEKLDRMDGVPAYAYALGALNVLSLGSTGYLALQRRWTPRGSGDGDAIASVRVRDPAARMIRDVLLQPAPPAVEAAPKVEPVAAPAPPPAAQVPEPAPEPPAPKEPSPEPVAPPVLVPEPVSPIVSA